MDNMLSQLQSIASESANNTAQIKSTELIEATEKQNLESIFNTASTMYPANQKNAVNYILKTVKTDTMKPNTINNYWSLFETTFPDYSSQLKEQLITNIKTTLNTKQSDSEKEFYLRDLVDTLPPWASETFYPTLAQVSMNVANANMSKATQVYKTELDTRIQAIRNSSLDPEVASSVHTNDLIKLETMNMLNSARVINGRIAVITQDGTVIMANELKNRAEVFGAENIGLPSLHEQVEVERLSKDIITDAVNTSIKRTRAEVTKQNAEISFETRMNLEKGMFTIDEWDTAFATINTNNIQQAITSGLYGEINAGRIKTNKDLQETLFAVLIKYKDMLGVK